jgi:predicted DNA-binding WGR domain protein
MSTTTRTFEYKDDKSSKFWEVTQNSSTVTVRYGKTGTNGQSQDKVFDDATATSKHVDKLINEKTGKGYVEKVGGSSAGTETRGVIPEPSTQPDKPIAKKAPKSSAVKQANSKNPAQDPEPTPESLLLLFGKDDATNRLLAKHPRASSKLLEKLSHCSDKATREAVAENPNTPSKTLQKLGAQFPAQLLNNPALDWMVLENPSLFSEIPEDTLAAIAKREDCSPAMLGYLARAGHGKGLLMSLLQNGSTPKEAIRYLMDTKPEHLAERYEVPEDSIRQIKSLVPMHVTIAGDLDEPNALSWFYAALVERLAPIDKGDYQLLVQASVPKTVLDDVIAWSVLVGSREAALTRMDLPPPVLEVLAVTGDKRLLAGVKKVSNCPDTVKLAASPDDARQRILDSALQDSRGHIELIEVDSLPMLYLLTDHPRYASRISKAEVLQRMVQCQYPSEMTLSFIAANPEIDDKAFDLLLAILRDTSVHRSNTVYCALGDLASNARTPPHLIMRIFHEVQESHLVKWTLPGLAENPSTPPEILNSLASQGSKFAGELASNPSTPPEVLQSLADRGIKYAEALASNSSAPIDFLLRLAKEQSKKYGLALLANQKLTEEAVLSVVEGLSGDVLFNDVGASRVLVHKNCSGRVLDALVVRNSKYKGYYWDESWKQKVAKDDRLSEQSFLLLANDSDLSLAIVKNPATTVTVLEKLLKSRDIQVRKEAERAINQRVKLASKGS